MKLVLHVTLPSNWRSVFNKSWGTVGSWVRCRINFIYINIWQIFIWAKMAHITIANYQYMILNSHTEPNALMTLYVYSINLYVTVSLSVSLSVSVSVSVSVYHPASQTNSNSAPSPSPTPYPSPSNTRPSPPSPSTSPPRSPSHRERK